MHGTVGVAPALNEARSALTPGDWGGNMDTPEMRSGVTCYFGVNVEGALVQLWRRARPSRRRRNVRCRSGDRDGHRHGCRSDQGNDAGLVAPPRERHRNHHHWLYETPGRRLSNQPSSNGAVGRRTHRVFNDGLVSVRLADIPRANRQCRRYQLHGGDKDPQGSVAWREPNERHACTIEGDGSGVLGDSLR